MEFKTSILQITTILILVLIGQAKFENVTTSGTSAKVDNGDREFLNKAGEFASRMIWMNKRRKFVLPKGTVLTIAPKITLPVFRHKPYDGGLNSDIQASWYFYMYFDKLGMTSDDHPWPFDMPPFYPFGSLMRTRPKPSSQAENKEDKNQDTKPFPNIRPYSSKEENREFRNDKHYRKPYVPMYDSNRYSSGRLNRNRRFVMSLPPPENIHGGERAIIMPSIESLMSNFGFEGRACLLRAICEIHEFPLGSNGFGLFGEMITLFFSISESPYAESHMPDYLRAEMDGKAGDCSFYCKNCTKSIFTWEPKGSSAEEILNNVV